MSADPAADRAYFPELDGLRTVAFGLVFGFHGGFPWLGEVVTLLTLPFFVVASLIGPATGGAVAEVGPAVELAIRRNGWVGVQLFFILSGFLITTLLLREERRHGRVDLRAFWIRRALRIWPLYYLTVLLTFLVIPLLDGRARSSGHWAMVRVHLPWFLAFLGNWSMIRNGPVGDDAISILWSVCVEEQFYLALPLIVALVRPRWRLGLVGLGIVAAIAARAALAATRPDQWAIQYNTLAQLDTILAGVGLALVLDRRPRVPVGPIVGASLIVASASLLSRPDLAHLRPARQTFDFVAIWLVGAGLVAYPVVRDGSARRSLATGVLVRLGRISYGLYMLHEMALGATGRGSGPSVLALLVTVGLAWASYRWFESPFLRIKARWTRVPSRPI